MDAILRLGFLQIFLFVLKAGLAIVMALAVICVIALALLAVGYVGFLILSGK